MKRQSFLLLFLAAGLGACRQQYREVKLEVRQLTAAVYASGTLVPANEYRVVSLVDGYLTRAVVKEGDAVRKGELLFTVNNEVRKAQEQNARSIVAKTAPATGENSPLMQELRGRLEVTKVKLQQDSLNYRRYKNLYEQDAVSKVSYERYYLQYQITLQEYRNLRQQLQQQRITSGLQLQQAKGQLEVTSTQAGVGNLKSYMDGVVYEIYKKEGDLIVPNQPIALIGEGNMLARLLVDEDDLSKVQIGQKVLITMDAYRDKVFKARVQQIYPILSKVEQSFRIDAVFDEPLPVEMYGLNLEANIIVAEKKQVMTIPRAALLKGDSVMVKQGKELRKVKIVRGLEDENYIEVRGGLSPQSVIVIE